MKNTMTILKNTMTMKMKVNLLKCLFIYFYFNKLVILICICIFFFYILDAEEIPRNTPVRVNPPPPPQKPFTQPENEIPGINWFCNYLYNCVWLTLIAFTYLVNICLILFLLFISFSKVIQIHQKWNPL